MRLRRLPTPSLLLPVTPSLRPTALNRAEVPSANAVSPSPEPRPRIPTANILPDGTSGMDVSAIAAAMPGGVLGRCAASWSASMPCSLGDCSGVSASHRAVAFIATAIGVGRNRRCHSLRSPTDVADRPARRWRQRLQPQAASASAFAATASAFAAKVSSVVLNCLRVPARSGLDDTHVGVARDVLEPFLDRIGPVLEVVDRDVDGVDLRWSASSRLRPWRTLRPPLPDQKRRPRWRSGERSSRSRPGCWR